MTGLCGRLCWVNAKPCICCNVFHTAHSPQYLKRVFSLKQINFKFRGWTPEIWLVCVGDCVESAHNVAYVVVLFTQNSCQKLVCFLTKTNKLHTSGLKIWDLIGWCGRLYWASAKHYICCSVFYTELSPEKISSEACFLAQSP